MHDTKFLLVPFLEKQRKEDTQRRLASWKCWLRRNKELISWYKSELNFEEIFTCFSWPLDFISSTVIHNEQRRNQIITVKEKASVASDYSS